MKNRVRELRKGRGMSQAKLATQLEVSRQTVNSIENGRYSPSLFLAFKLGKFFALPIEELFYEEEAKMSADAQVAMAVETGSAMLGEQAAFSNA